MTGTVKWFNNAKRYGFIRRDDGPDVFVHYSAIRGEGYRTLSEGDPVEFEIVQGPKGPQAVNVSKKRWTRLSDREEAGLLPAALITLALSSEDAIRSIRVDTPGAWFGEQLHRSDKRIEPNYPAELEVRVTSSEFRFFAYPYPRTASIELGRNERLLLLLRAPSFLQSSHMGHSGLSGAKYPFVPSVPCPANSI